MKAGDRIFLWYLGAAVITIAALWLFEEPLLAALIERIPPWIGMPGVLLVSLGIIWRLLKIHGATDVADRLADADSAAASTQPARARWIPAGAHAVAIIVIPILDGAIVKPMLTRYPGIDVGLATRLLWVLFFVLYAAILAMTLAGKEKNRLG